ncbi:hypothetical protein K1719_001071 [Acacia pycnantha]|nr:hypothetical protein K1719_001071 [Acacia pycnantha]
MNNIRKIVDNDLALKIYIKARAIPKVVAAFAERKEFDKILIYSKQKKKPNLTLVRFNRSSVISPSSPENPDRAIITTTIISLSPTSIESSVVLQRVVTVSDNKGDGLHSGNFSTFLCNHQVKANAKFSSTSVPAQDIEPEEEESFQFSFSILITTSIAFFIRSKNGQNPTSYDEFASFPPIVPKVPSLS